MNIDEILKNLSFEEKASLCQGTICNSWDKELIYDVEMPWEKYADAIITVYTAGAFPQEAVYQLVDALNREE